jgi:hypothetical protein
MTSRLRLVPIIRCPCTRSLACPEGRDGETSYSLAACVLCNINVLLPIDGISSAGELSSRLVCLTISELASESNRSQQGPQPVVR